VRDFVVRKSNIRDVAAGSGGSVVVERCQGCASPRLERIVFLGYFPPANTLHPIGTRPAEHPAYPAELLRCPQCGLAQIGTIVDPAIIFPPDYAYTSGTTRALRDNFADLYGEVMQLFPLRRDDLVVDIGSNDGTLLGLFRRGGHRVCGVEPTQSCALAEAAGIPTIQAFFTPEVAARIRMQHGEARLVAATNVLAHIEDIHTALDDIVSLMADDGLLVSESHYLVSLLETLQYDAVYHEHLRYFSLSSLKHLLEAHGLEVVHARAIPTHGGSMRVYAARQGRYQPSNAVHGILAAEEGALTATAFADFGRRASAAKLGLMALLRDVRSNPVRIYAIGAPSRAMTLISYVGLDETIVDCALEVGGSFKIGKYIPGTLIPVRDESALFQEQPDYALLLSWHIGQELAVKLRRAGFRGRFIMPLPAPRILDESEV
jgi:hypothetical protein